MRNNNVMDLIFDDEKRKEDRGDSLFDLIDDDINTQPIEFSYQTSESVNPEDSLFTEIQRLNIIED